MFSLKKKVLLTYLWVYFSCEHIKIRRGFLEYFPFLIFLHLFLLLGARTFNCGFLLVAWMYFTKYSQWNHVFHWFCYRLKYQLWLKQLINWSNSVTSFCHTSSAHQGLCSRKLMCYVTAMVQDPYWLEQNKWAITHVKEKQISHSFLNTWTLAWLQCLIVASGFRKTNFC